MEFAIINNLPTVVIAAAGPPREEVMSIASKSRILSAAMISVNGKPIIGWILDDLIKNKFKNFIILIPKKDELFKRYISYRYPLDANFITLEVEDTGKSLGITHSLFEGIKQLKNQKQAIARLICDQIDSKGLLFVLGHTICDLPSIDSNSYTKDFVYYSSVDEDEISRWCYIETFEDEGIEYVDKFSDKPEKKPNGNKALIGIYYLKCIDDLFAELKNIGTTGTAKFSDVLDKYIKRGHPLKAIPIHNDGWYDCGTVIGLNKTKTKKFDFRVHNPLEVDQDRGVIIKKSLKTNDLHDEYLWYISLPEELKTIVPRVVSFTYKKNLSLTEYAKFELEYYGYQTLAEAWVYDNWHVHIWYWTIGNLLNILRSFRVYKSKLDKECYSKMYWKKTVERIASLNLWLDKKDDNQAISNNKKRIKDLLMADTLLINNVEHVGWSTLKHKIKDKIETLYCDDKYTTIIHGDYHFGNILFDVYTKLTKLIDPRGNFGVTGVFGDCKYDLAKLRHSISGGYNFISNDLFQFMYDNDKTIKFTIPYNDEHIKIVKWFDIMLESEIIDENNFGIEKFILDDIKLIEGLLFMSMLPLQYDHPERLNAYLTRGIMILNEVVSSDPQKETIRNENMKNLYQWQKL